MADFDVVIAGGGGAGCLAAWRLARRGLRVAIVERGGPPPGTSCTPERLRRPPAVNLLRDADGGWPYRSGRYSWVRATGLGGRLNWWLGTALRFEPVDFSPWPIDYEDLAPYYDEVEAELGVAPIAPFPYDVVDEWMAAAAESCGARVAPACQAATTDHRRPAPSPLDRWIPEAVATGRCWMLPSTIVRRVLPDPGVEVTIAGSGDARALRAPVVLLATSTIETARVLLESGGLGDRSGLVGKGLMDHVVVWARALLRPPPGTAWSPARPAQTCFIPEWPQTGSPAQAPSRFQVQVMVHGTTVAGGETLVAIALAAVGEALRLPGNEVVLDPEGRRDRSGGTLPLVRFDWDGAHLTFAGRMRAALLELIGALPCEVVAADADDGPRLGGYGHEVGTARMGSDPAASVVSAAGEVHGAANVFVVDGSPFASYPHRNPTLTILANCARVCDEVARRV